MAENKDYDDVTGVETTGHEWDGIKELNQPLPKWWLYVFYATIIWSVGYWIAYPAWPLVSSYTKGVLGYSQRDAVRESIQEARAAQSEINDRVDQASLREIKDTPELLQFAMAGGEAAFGDNCAPCHGRGAQGFEGYPNLNDDEWIWGGTLEAIHQTIQYGIRNENDQSRFGQMPRFGLDGLLTEQQISDVADYVLSLSGGEHDDPAAERGKTVYEENCALSR